MKQTISSQSSHNFNNTSLTVQSEPDPTDKKPTSLGSHLCINSSGNTIYAAVNAKRKKICAPKVSDSFDQCSDHDKENVVPNNCKKSSADSNNDHLNKDSDVKLAKNYKDKIGLRPSSLELCIQMNEPETSFGFGSKVWDAGDTESTKSVNIWDYSDSEAAPASSWSTLPNRALMSRALPMDVGECSCVILKEAAPRGLGCGFIYSLYTNEGKGRQNRKLAVAYHKRRSGRSVFIVAQNTKGVLSNLDDSFLGLITTNLMGSRYCIWDKVNSPTTTAKESKLLQGVVEFTPTIATWTGSYRGIKAWIPKHQSPEFKKNVGNQHVKALPLECEKHKDQVQLLCSRVPQYNKITKKYELDFREKIRAGLRIRSSVKNFQLTMEGNGRQNILQLGRVGKSKYMLDYMHPLTGYQAFCICLASIDPKLCCIV